MSMKPPDQGAQPYLVVAPDGDHIEIPKELFVALSDFLQGREPSGSVVIHFRNGDIAGLEGLVKKKYKQRKPACSLFLPAAAADYPIRLSEAGRISPLRPGWANAGLEATCGGFEKCNAPSSTELHFRLMVSRK
jgi:hypothetical protein